MKSYLYIGIQQFDIMSQWDRNHGSCNLLVWGSSRRVRRRRPPESVIFKADGTDGEAALVVPGKEAVLVHAVGARERGTNFGCKVVQTERADVAILNFREWERGEQTGPDGRERSDRQVAARRVCAVRLHLATV